MSAHCGRRLAEAAAALKTSTDGLLETAKSDQEAVLAAAADYLKQFGNVAAGYYLTRGAVAAALLVNEDASSAAYYESKVEIARFFADRYLTEAVALTHAVASGAAPRIDAKLLSA